MRQLFAAVLLLAATTAFAADAVKPMSIAIEPLGDRDDAVVARLFFRFANPHAITRAGLFLEGSVTQAGAVPRNFRFRVPRKDDKHAWTKTVMHNNVVVHEARWTRRPDQQNEMVLDHLFLPGEAEVQVWLVLDGDFGDPPRYAGDAHETFTIAKTNRPLPAEEPEVVVPASEPVFVQTSPVAMQPPKRNGDLLTVNVDVLAPVKRVEFRLDDRKVLVRNAPPYTAELDLGSRTQALIRAVGFDDAGRYVGADAFYAGESDDHIAVKLARMTADGIEHFQLAVWNPQATALKSVAVFAGDKKLHEWTTPPYTFSIPAAELTAIELLRAVVVDESGYEATDRLTLR